MRKYIYGIDFGTSNSALAILDVEKNEIVRLFTLPSLLFFPENAKDYYVGKEAIEKYVASHRKGRFMKSVKRVLPNKSFKDTKIQGKPFTAEELVSLIISALKKEADAFLGENITTAVIGRPVVFDENPEKDALAQSRLQKAVALAGIETSYFQMEPIGAAFTYERQLQQAELVLVADFGGGTSDFTLMQLNPQAVNEANRKADMRAKGGIYLGGDNFDMALMWQKGTPHFGKGLEYQSQPNKWLPVPISFFLNICSWEKMNFFDSIKIKNEVKTYYNLSGQQPKLRNLLTLIEQNLGYHLFTSLEKTKIALSQSDATDFSFHEAGIDFEEKITVGDFADNIIKNELQQIDNYLVSFLDRFQISPQDINSVFMTGGTSLVRPLQQTFIQRFGAEKVKSGDNFHSVAMGLAYSYVLFV
ncbi:MAG: Hsp70 family protein [Bacteroidia bacterium]